MCVNRNYISNLPTLQKSRLPLFTIVYDLLVVLYTSTILCNCLHHWDVLCTCTVHNITFQIPECLMTYALVEPYLLCGLRVA